MSSHIVQSISPARKPSVRTVVLASVLGTTIEWYDFLLYGTAAALIFNRLFFPTFDPLVGTLFAFSTYAVGFIARPVGGIIFGHYGDRLGRKSMLILTMLIMGLGTFLIGAMPTYATIGVWAPILLVTLRFLQGLGIGGEWGGAVLMAVEFAPPGRRGLYGSLVQVGFPLGLVLSTAIFAVFTRMPDAQFIAWGWRIPFLLSIVLVVIGLFVRLRLAETPAFAAIKADHREARMPIAEVLIGYRRNLLIALGVRVTEVSWVYILTVFVIVYATKHLGLPRSMILNGILLAAVIELFTVPIFGALSDRIGRRPIYFAGAALAALIAFPLFWLIDTRQTGLIWLAVILGLSIGHGMMYGPQASFLSELFGTRVRYSGVSLGCQLSAAIGGGFSPIIATALLAWAGAPWAVSLFMAGLAVITIIAVSLARETAQTGLTEAPVQQEEQSPTPLTHVNVT